jgi:FtsH-binding integral membrane protein
MTGDSTVILGIEIPTTDPVFVGVIVGTHIPLGLACVIAGAAAMFYEKRRGTHSTLGTIYYWCLTLLFASAAFLTVMRWDENYHLFVVGALSFASAWFGRKALRERWRYWARLHITGMGLSYVMMLVAFYVDNGKQLPFWKDLPQFTYWLLPLAVGIPLIVRALVWHPRVRDA